MKHLITPNNQINQSQVLSPYALQSLSVLAMQQEEFETWVQQQIENNPLLISLEEGTTAPISREEERAAAHGHTWEDLIPAQKSLYAHLIDQVLFTFSEQSQIDFATWVIGSLDQRGLLDSDLEEYPGFLPFAEKLSVLKAIHNMDPIGVGATNVQETLLIQLETNGKKNNFAYRLLTENYDALLRKDWEFLSKYYALSVDMLLDIVQRDIHSLNPYPGYAFSHEYAFPLHFDLVIMEQEGRWTVDIGKGDICSVVLNEIDQSQLQGQEHTWHYKYSIQAKNVIRAIEGRVNTLKRIGELLLRTQYSFLSGEEPFPALLSIETAAEDLGLHRSTISRAVNLKMVSCPRGTYPLKFFFQPSMQKSAQATLLQLIASEDKSHPLSDDEIMTQLQGKGIRCARRTVAKYRQKLNIQPRARRRASASSRTAMH